MPQETKGKCLCGASGFVFATEVKFAFQCYCTDCQHVSGGGHLPQVGIDRATFKSAGKIKHYKQKSDGGNELTFSFCGDCGSPLFKATDKMPDTVFVYPGSLLHPPQVDFSKRVFESSRQPWDAA